VGRARGPGLRRIPSPGPGALLVDKKSPKQMPMPAELKKNTPLIK
jgi:hypothetical protein